jgi:hypothetical protein
MQQFIPCIDYLPDATFDRDGWRDLEMSRHCYIKYI